MGRFTLAALIALFAAATAHADPRPFRLVGNQLVMPVKIGGRDTLALIDTGASNSAIAAPLANALQLSAGRVGGTFGASGSVPYKRSDSIRIDLGGGFAVDRHVGVLNEIVAGEGVEAIVGLDILYNQVVSIDFDEMKIDFTPSRAFKAPAAPPQKLQDWPPMLRISLGDRDADAIIDTAASDAIYLSPRFARWTPAAKNLPALQTLLAGVGGTSARPIFSLPRVVIGGTSFTGVPAAVIASDVPASKADAIIGIDLLRQFNLVIDYGGHRLWMTPNKSCGAPLQRNRIGLFLYASAGQGRVRMIAPGSPAEKAGLMAGDMVGHIEDADGRTITDPATLPEGAAIVVVMADGARRKLVTASYY